MWIARCNLPAAGEVSTPPINMGDTIACPDGIAPEMKYEGIPAHVTEQPPKQNGRRFWKGARLPTALDHVSLASAEEPLRRLVALSG